MDALNLIQVNTMRINTQQYEALSQYVSPYLNQASWDKYKARGLSFKRWRWDQLYTSEATSITGDTLRDTFVIRLYRTGLNDDHIDTALRRIIKDRGIIE